MQKIFAMVDCNNFYASCERLFRPELNNQPIVVLSNNDGCVIDRSNEAKALGLSMGGPYFKIKDMLAKHNVHVAIAEKLSISPKTVGLVGDTLYPGQVTLRTSFPVYVHPVALCVCRLQVAFQYQSPAASGLTEVSDFGNQLVNPVFHLLRDGVLAAIRFFHLRKG